MLLKRSHIAALHDIFMAGASFVLSLYLRLGDRITDSFDYLLPGVLLFTGVCTVVFSLTGLYKGVWRYASIQDLTAITKAVTLAILIFLPLMFLVTRLEDFPRSVIIINWLVLMVFLGGPRFVYRIVKDRGFFFTLKNNACDKRIPVLLAGISDTAIHFLRESANKHSSDYRVVGIIDANTSTIGSHIHNVKVYSNFDAIPKVVKKLKRENNAPQRIILGSDHVSGAAVRNLLKTADTLGLTLAKLPKLTEFKDNIEKLTIKPIAIEDLLGRAQTTPNLGRRRELVEGKTILVTGAGGTIGSELVRQIAVYNPAKLILFELSEFNLYQIDKELEENFPETKIKSLIGDIRRRECLDALFAKEKPQLVFHAAALKHVPIVEENLTEAALTNIIGTKNIADMALKHGAEKMVLISTDKAVNPSSLMGVTKRLAECYIQGLGHSKGNNKTDFLTVRFGNVLGSSGSVIPLFQKQLERGGPITVTHPDMTRYFMTVPEAVELVLQASTLGTGQHAEHSAIFVLDMGEPVRISDLATQMITLAGLRPDTDIKIDYIGMRPGEKLFEELFYENEESEDTLYEGILLARARKVNFDAITRNIETIEKLCTARNETELLTLLTELVPEYEANQTLCNTNVA